MPGTDPIPPAPRATRRVPGQVRAPEQELRFTRSRQAAVFWVLAGVCAAAALVLFAGSLHRGENPGLPHPLWALAPAAGTLLAARLALHCIRHAYLILTPLGIEIFPFVRPARGMQLVPWAQIHAADFDPATARLTLHFNAARTAGIVLSLAPLRRDRRPWLARAVQGRLTARATPPPAAARPADPA